MRTITPMYMSSAYLVSTHYNAIYFSMLGGYKQDLKISSKLREWVLVQEWAFA